MKEIESQLRAAQQQIAALTQQFRAELKELQDNERAAEQELTHKDGDVPAAYAVVAERVERGELSWYDVISGRASDPDASECHESLWNRLDAIERGDVILFEDPADEMDGPDGDGASPVDAVASGSMRGDDENYSRFVIGGRR